MAEIVSAFPTSIAMSDNGVQRIAEATVYAATDLSFTTPLAITDLQGVPFTGGKLTTTTGQFPQFKAPAGITQVLVKSGDRITLLTDLSVYAGAAMESATAAAGSAGSAESSRAAAALARSKAEQAAADAKAVGATTDQQMKAVLDNPTAEFTKAQTAMIGGVVADDATLVRTSGAQSLAGVKTFAAPPVVPDASFTIAKTSGLAAALSGKIAAGAAAGNVVIGSDQVHTPPADTNTGFEVVKSITDPDKRFLGSLSGYTVYFGAEKAGAGSIQGGACEAYSLMTGAVSHAVLGWEGIGVAAGTGSYQQVIGLASTAIAKDSTSVQQLMGFQARGPLSDGSPTVANAYSIKVLEPTVGTQRHALHVIGRTTLSLGVHNRVLEILGTSAVKRWDVDGNGAFAGFASDGSSVRLRLRPDETSTGKIVSDAYDSATKHASFQWQSAERLAVLADGFLMFGDALRQTTVGAAGSASALPAQPTTYVRIKTASGTTLVIPAYLAA